MRKQVSLSQLFTQTDLESVVFNSIILNILKIHDTNPPFKKTQTLYYLGCKNAFNLHFFHQL
ncbi:hypothetical protein FIM66_05605 [Helicobacter pylori]|nr:hypothetical protein FIM66_05605 [Helicobacter pylori]